MRRMPQTTRPDYHFLYFAPSLGAEWFFDAARLYWETFQPTVLSDLEFLRFVPEGASVNVTVVARRDTVHEIGVAIAQTRGEVFLGGSYSQGFSYTGSFFEANQFKLRCMGW